MKSTERVGSYRERQAKIKRFKREAYLTSDEWIKVKAYIVDIRKSKP